MSTRLDPFAAAPQLMKPMVDFSLGLNRTVDASLRELVKLRASQINGCAVCLHMHAVEARQQGESELRILMLDAWRESSLYTARERAALEWTEALTRLTETGAPDAAYEAVKREFGDEEVVALTLLITMINAWNRIGVGFRRSHP